MQIIGQACGSSPSQAKAIFWFTDRDRWVEHLCTSPGIAPESAHMTSFLAWFWFTDEQTEAQQGGERGFYPRSVSSPGLSPLSRMLPELRSLMLCTDVNIPSAPIFPSPSLSAAAIKDLVSDSVSSLAPLSNFWRKNLRDNEDQWGCFEPISPPHTFLC